MLKLKQTLCFALLLFVSLPVFSQTSTQPHDVIVGTDSMLDDITAITTLLRDPRYAEIADHVLAFVITSGNPTLKAAIVNQIVSESGRKIPIIIGTASDYALGTDAARLFVHRYKNEGRGILPEKLRLALAALPFAEQGGDAIPALQGILRAAAQRSHRVDFLAMAPPTDFAKVIESDKGLARDVLGGFFSMGLNKNLPDGTIVIPFNGSEAPVATVRMFEYYQEGIFENFLTLPSEAMGRVGLPNGYIPDDPEILAALDQLAKDDPLYRRIRQMNGDYQASWRDTGVAKHGMNSWALDTFMPVEHTSRVFLADPFTLEAYRMYRAGEKIDTRSRKLWAQMVPDGGHSKVLIREDTRGRNASRDVQEIYSLPGQELVRSIVKGMVEGPRRKAISIFPPLNLTPRQAAATAEAGKSSSTHTEPLATHSTFDEALRAARAIPTAHPTDVSKNKAIVMTFKNSPDDWFALFEIVADPDSLEALRKGGIIAEGFYSKGIADNLHLFLTDLGITTVPVAVGHTYTAEEAKASGNLSVEKQFHKNKLSTAAFAALKKKYGVPKTYPSAEALLAQVTASAKKDNLRVHNFILGEGIDVTNANDNTEYGKHLGTTRDMGGGRRDLDKGDDAYVLTRNWDRRGAEGIDAFKRLAKNSDVVVYDSTNYSGAMFKGEAGDVAVGKGENVFRTLEKLRASSLAMAAVLDHSTNWTRSFMHWKALKADPKAKLSAIPLNPSGIMVGVNSVYMVQDLIAVDIHGGRTKNKEVPVDIEPLKTGKVYREVADDKGGIFWSFRDPESSIEHLASSEVVPSLEHLAHRQRQARIDQIIRDYGPQSDRLENYLREIGFLVQLPVTAPTDGGGSGAGGCKAKLSEN